MPIVTHSWEPRHTQLWSCFFNIHSSKLLFFPLVTYSSCVNRFNWRQRSRTLWLTRQHTSWSKLSLRSMSSKLDASSIDCTSECSFLVCQWTPPFWPYLIDTSSLCVEYFRLWLRIVIWSADQFQHGLVRQTPCSRFVETGIFTLTLRISSCLERAASIEFRRADRTVQIYNATEVKTSVPRKLKSDECFLLLSDCVLRCWITSILVSKNSQLRSKTQQIYPRRMN